MIAEPAWGPDGLVPAVVQDEADGRVLMVAYMDAEALTATLETGEVHFHSRSRGRLWRKGETSGRVLHLVRIDLDCDKDAILATVHPAASTCHRGTRSCFDSVDLEKTVLESQGFAWLETLWATIDARRRARMAGSYTTSLIESGVDAAGRKVTEEATEMLMAAKNDAVAEAAGENRDATSAALAGEAADLLFHALVLLAERGQHPRTTIETLRRRHQA